MCAVAAVFLGYNFMFADAPAGVVPPGSNAAAPLNVGGIAQIKNGGLSLNSLLVAGNMQVTGAKSTFTQVRATEYCDENGENCTVPATSNTAASFGGAYIGVRGGRCLNVNPVTGNCTCPSSYAPFILHSDEERRYGPEHSGGAYLGSTYTDTAICIKA